MEEPIKTYHGKIEYGSNNKYITVILNTKYIFKVNGHENFSVGKFRERKDILNEYLRPNNKIEIPHVVLEKIISDQFSRQMERKTERKALEVLTAELDTDDLNLTDDQKRSTKP